MLAKALGALRRWGDDDAGLVVGLQPSSKTAHEREPGASSSGVGSHRCALRSVLRAVRCALRTFGQGGRAATATGRPHVMCNICVQLYE